MGNIIDKSRAKYQYSRAKYILDKKANTLHFRAI